MLETLDPSTRASVVFARLKDMPIESRGRLLDAECADDPALRTEVEIMLSAADEEPQPAAHPTPHDVASGADTTSRTRPGLGPFGPGVIIAGQYRLVRILGRGGLSVVWLARQEAPVERWVALKLLAPGLETPTTAARFEGERNALSRMGHPFVARIYDAGYTDHGQAFVAMEHIDGPPIDEYCRRRRLDRDARLRLFVRVCRGVAHAHQKGVIHRDLKPSNILVVDDDGEATPKVIDFGIAKSTTGSLTSAPNATRMGFVVGTPGYMSPEQASGTGKDVDTTTDVYALGVILYELLTGTLPIAPPDPGQVDMTKWREVLATTRPEPMSQRLRARNLHGQLVAAQSLVGDLDLIAEKALARDPETRYRTVSELAGDIERTLAGEPILARPPSIGYLLGRIVKRHRLALVMVALIAVAMIGATIVIAKLAAAMGVADEEAALARERAAVEGRHAQERVLAAERAQGRGALAASQTAVHARNTAAASRHLNAVPTALRGWEWRWLAHSIDRNDVRVAGRGSPITALTIDATGTLLVSLDARGALTLSADDGRGLTTIATLAAGSDGGRQGLAVDFGRDLALVSDGQRALCAWDLATERRLWCRSGAYGLTPDSGDDNGEVVVGTPGGVEILAIESGVTMARHATPSGSKRAAWAWLGGTRLMLVWGNDQTMALDWPPGATAGLVRWRRGGTVDQSPRTSGVLTIAGWARFGEREVVDLATGVTFDTFTSRGPFLTALLLGSDGASAAVELGSAVTLRPSLNAAPSADLLGHRAPITSGVAGPGVFWFGDAAGEIRRWRADLEPAPKRVARTNDVIFAGALAPRTQRVFTVGWGMLKAWDRVSGGELWSRWLGREYLLAVAARDDAVVVGDASGRLAWLDAESGHFVAAERPLASAVVAIAVSGDWTVAGSVDGEIVGLVGGRTQWKLTNFVRSVGALAVDRGGRFVAVAGGDPARMAGRRGMSSEGRRDARVLVLDLASGAILAKLDASASDAWLSLTWSDDGTTLAGGGTDGSFALWPIVDGRASGPSARLPALGQEVHALAFTRDGTRLFVGDEQGAIQVWTLPERELLATLSDVGGAVLHLGMDADDVLIALSDNFPIVIFDPRPPSVSVARDDRLWQERARVRGRLDALLATEGVSADILRAAADQAFGDGERLALLAMARARGDNPNQLNSEAWAAVRYPGEPPQRVALARKKAEACAHEWPLWEFENTRALARWRARDPEGAIASARTSMALARQGGNAAYPVEWSVIALAEQAAGRRAAALDALAEAEEDIRKSPWDADGEARSLVDEARRALAE